MSSLIYFAAVYSISSSYITGFFLVSGKYIRAHSQSGSLNFTVNLSNVSCNRTRFTIFSTSDFNLLLLGISFEIMSTKLYK